MPEIYDSNGYRVMDLYSTGNDLELYVWDGVSDLRVWPDAAPDRGPVLNMAWPGTPNTQQWNGLPSSDNASSQFSDAHGLRRIDWNETFYGRVNEYAKFSWLGADVAVGNTTVENWGLLQDYTMSNIASCTYNQNDGGAAVMNLKWYDLEPIVFAIPPATNTYQRWRWDFSYTGSSDPDYTTPQAPFANRADIKWYGERVFLGEVTETITNITAYSVYHGNNDLRFFFDSPSSGGAALRFSTDPQRVMVERGVSTYNESAYDYVRRTGRHIVTIERNDYDPGNEYIIAGKDNASSGISGSYYVYPPVPSNSAPSAVDIPLINYSNNPADQDSLTVVTGENVTFRLYEDLI